MAQPDPAPPLPDSPPAPRWTPGRWLLLGIIVAVAITFFALGGHETLTWDAVLQRQDELRAFRDQRPLLTGVLFIVAYLIVAALALPGVTVLTLLGGFLFGRWGGTPLVSFASTLGAVLAFLGSRYLFREAVQRRLGARLETLNRGVERDGAFYLVTLRLIAVVPFFLVNVGMGLTRMRLTTFWWVSQLAMLPATILFVNAGAEWEKVRSPGDVLSPTLVISLALLGVCPLLLRLGLRWWQRRREGRAG